MLLVRGALFKVVRHGAVLRSWLVLVGWCWVCGSGNSAVWARGGRFYTRGTQSAPREQHRKKCEGCRSPASCPSLLPSARAALQPRPQCPSVCPRPVAVMTTIVCWGRGLFSLFFSGEEGGTGGEYGSAKSGQKTDNQIVHGHSR